jgi:hypothetical protein
VVVDNETDTVEEVQAKIEERLALAHIEESDIVFSTDDPGCASVADCWRESGKEMTVSVATQFRMGLIGALLDWAGGPAEVTISTQATMRNE